MYKLFFNLSVLIIILSSTLFSQGKIISSSEADQLFGPVQTQISISTSQLSSIIQQTNNVVMFQIINNKLYILGDNRTLLYPSDGEVDPSTVFSVYSKQKVLELLESASSNLIKIELRKEVLTITVGNLTMEFAQDCPPFC